MGCDVVPDCSLDHLLLLRLERGQVHRKGILISTKAVVKVYTVYLSMP